jgi:hypothetical protein
MAKLRFFARDDQLVPFPGFTPAPGQIPVYVGRSFDEKLKGHPASQEPSEFDSETREGQRLMQFARRDAALWPADEATARECGVEFVPVTVRDGVAVPAAKASPAPAASPKKGAES